MLAAAALLGTAEVQADIPVFTAHNKMLAIANVGGFCSPTLADIDGDGDLDVFLGEDNGYTYFFENTGTASSPEFGPSSANPFGLADVGYLSRPTFADIDGDGDLDAFVGRTSGDVVFFENSGTVSSPAFGPSSVNPFGLADVGVASSPALVDIDGDSDLDALVGDYNGYTAFFENTGSSSAPAFASPTNSAFGLIDVGQFSRPSFADIDGDGDLDALAGQIIGHTVFQENTGAASAPAFGPFSSNSFSLPNLGNFTTPAFGDLDGDGDLDAFIGEWAGHTFRFENTGSASLPGFTRFEANPFGLADFGFTHNPTFGDIDGDGDLDAFVGIATGDTYFVQNTGTASAAAFAAQFANPFGLVGVAGTSSPTLVDIDGDGDLDIFVGDYSGDTVFFENTGTGTAPAFGPSSANPFGLTAGASINRASPEFVDLDGDGDLDVYIGELYGAYIFDNTGSATAPAFSPGFTPTGFYLFGYYRTNPSFADLDGDGDFDAFIGEQNGDTLFFPNVGTPMAPSFAATSANPFGLEKVQFYTSPTFADIDGDGDLDAFIGGSLGETNFFENNPIATTPTPTATPAATSTATATPTATPPPGGGPCPATPDTCLDVFQKGLLLVKEKSFGKEKIIAKFIKGPGFAQSTFGNPLAPGGTSYRLCIYGDDSALAGELAVDRAGDNCDGFKPCWKSLGGDPPTGKGFFYKDKNLASDGVKIIKLKGGSGSGTVLVKAANNLFKGQVAMPTGIAAALAGDTSATIQLQSSDAQCFSATLTDIKKAETLLFKGKK